jgi:hypothetical protein
VIRGQGEPCTAISLTTSAPCFKNAILRCAKNFVSASGLKDYVLERFAWHSTFSKVQFTLDSALSEQQPKAKRVTLSHGLLKVLEKDEENDFSAVLPGDEFWFYLKYSHESA